MTRGEGADGPLTLVLKARGARVLDWGSIGFAPPEDLCPFILGPRPDPGLRLDLFLLPPGR